MLALRKCEGDSSLVTRDTVSHFTEVWKSLKIIALFQMSLVRGLSAGIVLATGMLISDLTLVFVSYFSLTGLIIEKDYKIMGIIAGFILIAMGGSLFSEKVRKNSIKMPSFLTMILICNVWTKVAPLLLLRVKGALRNHYINLNGFPVQRMK